MPGSVIRSARYQHFQIARMRAIEAQRYMIRAANDGVSAVIGPHGEVVARAPEFVPLTCCSSTVTPRMGLPPYARVGNWLVDWLSSLAAYGAWRAATVGERRSDGGRELEVAPDGHRQVLQPTLEPSVRVRPGT